MAIKTRPLVLLLGDINLDIAMEVDHFPGLGEDAIARQTFIHVGGGVANSACVLASLGLAPRIFTRVGADPMGDYALHVYSRAGVDLSGVSHDPTKPTGVILVATVPGGERTMFSNRGANACLSPQEISASDIAGGRILQLSGYAFQESPQRDAAWKAVDLACDEGIPVSLDMAINPTGAPRENILRLLEKLDTCILGVEEARDLFGAQNHVEAAQALIERGVATAAVKLGSRGAYFARREESLFIPALPVQSLDATGAGDAFSAGLLYARVMGLSLAASGLLASALGALATTVRGAGPSLPGGADALRFLYAVELSGRYPDFVPAFAEVISSLTGSIISAGNPLEMN
jgi:sugar/nucleoside kinase (ribokinase family)